MGIWCMGFSNLGVEDDFGIQFSTRNLVLCENPCFFLSAERTEETVVTFDRPFVPSCETLREFRLIFVSYNYLVNHDFLQVGGAPRP